MAVDNQRRTTRRGRHRKPTPPHRSVQWLRVGVMTAGLGAAIAAGQGVANASTDDGGTSTGSTGPQRSTAAPSSEERSADRTTSVTERDDDRTTSVTERDDEDDDTDRSEPADDDADEDAADLDDTAEDSGDDSGGDEPPDELDEEPADTDAQQPAQTEVIEQVSLQTPEPTDNAGPPSDDPGPDQVPAAPAETLYLAVRDQQQRREAEPVAEIAASSEPAPDPGDPVAPSSARSALAPVTIAALEPPGWFTTAVHNTVVFVRDVVNVVVETTRRVVDATVRVVTAVVDGVVRTLWGDYDRIPVQTPTTTPGHWERLRTVTGGLLNDGFHIDRVLSAHDGQERLTVYIGGTTLGLNQMAVLNGLGWAQQVKSWQVDAIRRAQAGNPDIDILIVGFSQGGMDAQNLWANADALGLNVLMVLTFGSPIVQDPPTDPYDWMFHIQAKKDPVPDWGRPGLRDKARTAGIIFDTTTKTGDKAWADWNGLGEVHGDPATYREAAQKFDQWLSDSNMDYWEGQYLRYY